MGKLPRLLLCAAASGGGKTTVTCALLRALARRGLSPTAFKCGPDYIDPMFHREVIGVPSRNLDLFFLGEEITRHLLWENGRKGGISIIEGVMGYYDGIAMTHQASAYHLAKATGTPAVLVLDGRGRALTAAAAAKGMAVFRPDSNIQGVILNRISPMLYPSLKEAIETETGISVLGFLPNAPDCALESRHLGLVTAAEVENLKEKLDKLADLAERHLDLDGLTALADAAAPLEASSVSLPSPVKGKPRIAVAQDEAFCFRYDDGMDLLRRLGAELVPFSPLRDQALPPCCGGLYLCGGYPELYGKALSGNDSMRRSIREAVLGGMPTIAECGGFLYLHRTLTDQEGHTWPMAGALALDAHPTPRLQRFGYVTLTAGQDGLLGPAGTSFPAHEFHYWESDAPGADFHAQKPLSSRAWDCGYHTPTLYAGFPHFHWWAAPSSAKYFIEAAAAFLKQGGYSHEAE